jgi:hypothetical protein
MNKQRRKKKRKERKRKKKKEKEKKKGKEKTERNVGSVLFQHLFSLFVLVATKAKHGQSFVRQRQLQTF